MTDPTRESRRTVATESPFSPLSLVGSYALHNGDQLEQWLVIAEPNPGIYLLEAYDIVDDTPKCQCLMPIADLITGLDGEWLFYDTHAAVREAFVEMLRT